jgi:hypothetical protein
VKKWKNNNPTRWKDLAKKYYWVAPKKDVEALEHVVFFNDLATPLWGYDVDIDTIITRESTSLLLSFFVLLFLCECEEEARVKNKRENDNALICKIFNFENRNIYNSSLNIVK